VKTLAELNATTDTYDWGAYTLRRESAVGSVGRYGTNKNTGAKIHLLRIAVVVEERGTHKPGTYRVGSVFLAHAICNGNGQNVATAHKGLDTDAITCAKCLAAIS
jgi:hypothetical protein